MRISKISVSNFRNISGVDVVFNPQCNYIIGENNLGKSNFLSLLATICSGKGFEDDDFFDPEKPIEVSLTVKLKQEEQGFFGDSFSPDDSSLLNIRYTQSINDQYPAIICTDSNESIQLRQMRKLNFLTYQTTSIPGRELRLDTKKGTGLFISTIIERFVNNTSNDFLNNEAVERLTSFINEHLEKIRSFRDYSIKAAIAPETTDMLSSLYYLSDGSRKIETTGSGVQYMAMASINVLCQIMNLYKSKSIPFSELLYTDEVGNKMLPLILSIDEPEVHLHPFLQRSLIGYYKKIMQNRDAEFADLLKTCFDIDGIDGQLIIVTHSTDALAGDYRNLVRFYKNGNTTAAVSGYALRPEVGGANTIKSDDEKHLIMHFPEIKEAFYAKCAIIFEGETEYGCMHAFAEKLGVSCDDCGIFIINANGEKSIKPIRNLLRLFAIPSISVYDGDVMHKNTSEPNSFYTAEPCFEIEMVKALFSSSKTELVRRIALDLDSKAESTVLDVDFIKKGFAKYGRDISDYEPKKLSDVRDDDETDFCSMYSSWFMAKKGVLLGRVIGEAVPEDCIPKCYCDAIKKAEEVAKSE